MTELIRQRELHNDKAESMRRVERGERLTRNGETAADSIPHQPAKPLALGELKCVFVRLPSVDRDRWEVDRRTDDDIFGPDDPATDPSRR